MDHMHPKNKADGTYLRNLKSENSIRTSSMVNKSNCFDKKILYSILIGLFLILQFLVPHAHAQASTSTMTSETNQIILVIAVLVILVLYIIYRWRKRNP